MALVLNIRNSRKVAPVELTDEERAARIAADDEKRASTNKFLMNYVLIVAFGGVMASLGALVGFAAPGFIR